MQQKYYDRVADEWVDAPAKLDFNRTEAEMELDRIASGSWLGEDALLTPEHFAIILTCSVRFVARLRKAGRLPPAVRLGKLVRWRLSDVRAWVRAMCQG